MVHARLSGSGGLDGNRLRAGRADIAVSGPGTARVQVAERAGGAPAGASGQLLVVDRRGSSHAPQ